LSTGRSETPQSELLNERLEHPPRHQPLALALRLEPRALARAQQLARERQLEPQGLDQGVARREENPLYY